MTWYGNNVCFTCGIEKPWGELQCGHFISRRFMNTRFHPVNCWPQCNDCNVNKRGNLVIYEAKLRAKFGDDAIDGLIELAQSTDKVTGSVIEDIIKQYKP